MPQIAQRLAEGDPVLLFGEGTAGDGNRVLPFRTALIGAARDAIAGAGDAQQIWIQPLSIAYVSQQGIPLGRHLRPRAAWYGKMKLVDHIGHIARTGAIDVSVTWGEPVPYNGETDRKVLARDLEPDPGLYGRGIARKGAGSRGLKAGNRGEFHFCRKGGIEGRRAPGHQNFVKLWNSLARRQAPNSERNAQALRQILRLPDERLRFPSYGGPAGARGLRRDRVPRRMLTSSS